MSEAKPWYAGLEPRIRDHVDHIVQRFNNDPARPDISGVAAGRGVDFMHAERQLVVREQYLDQVRRILELVPVPERTFDPANGVRRITRGVVELTFEPGSAQGQREVPDIVDDIDKELGRGIATPNHVLTVAGGGDMGPCPATEPQPVDDGIEPSPGVSGQNGGGGVLIYIADTGVLQDAEDSHSWLQGVASKGSGYPWLRGIKSDVDPLPATARVGGQDIQPIDPYDGHGTFVAGVARCMAPQADIIVGNIFDAAGSALESDFVFKLDEALNLGVDIFVLSIASPTRNDVPLLSLQGWMERLQDYQGVVCVAPAGNSGTRRPCWPGAFPNIISVGALTADLRTRAEFSNYGSWVDVYAQGRDLINAYATGTYTYKVAPYTGQQNKFYGMARWSGTSFSTPIVAGLIAARMSQSGQSAQQAAEAVLAQARAQALPGVGPAVQSGS